MSEYTYHADAAKVFVIKHVINGIRYTAEHLNAEAKRAAPVRRTEGKRKAGRKAGPIAEDESPYRPNRTASEVRFYGPGGFKLDTMEALSLIGQAIPGKKKATAEQVAVAINRGDRDRVRFRDTYHMSEAQRNSARPHARTFAKLREAMTLAGVHARLAHPKGASYDVKSDVARLHGVTIDLNTGTATAGGRLKKSIHVVEGDPHQVGSSQIMATVRAGAPYAKYVEFPTVRTKAQPFLMPAYKKWWGNTQRLAQASKW